MIQASKLILQGQGLAAVLLKRAATVELGWDTRQKSRFSCTDSAGRELGVFLPRGTAVRGGDVLVAQDGSLIRVIAAPQAVLRITHCPDHGTPYDLIRAAYHLGNRHVPIELKPHHLKIEPDHVLADMLRAMHLIVNGVNESFEPENGAYASGGPSHSGHSRGHMHEHDEALANGHSHGHENAAMPGTTAAPHVHGPDCGHDHGQDHAHGPSHKH